MRHRVTVSAGWRKRVKDTDAVAVYETMGKKMQQRLEDLRGEVGPKHLEKVYPPAYAPNSYARACSNVPEHCRWKLKLGMHNA
eukprot:7389282-Prymnesium_polylepis.2